MELKIDLNSPKEIVFGLNLLNSLAMAVRAQQEAELGAAAQAQVQQQQQAAQPAVAPAPTENPSPGAAPVADVVAERVIRQTMEVVAKKSAPVAAAVTADAGPKRRGRPPKSAKQHASVAADQPVGAVLAGVPARDLAAALQAPVEHEVTSDELGDALADERAAEEAIESAVSTEEDGVVVHTDPDTSAEDTAALNAELQGHDAKHSDDDLSHLFSADNVLRDQELFGVHSEEDVEPVDHPYADKSDHDLYIMWRKEAGERPIHWGRAIVKKYNIRGEEDMTREILLEALLHPDQYMPPAVA